MIRWADTSIVRSWNAQMWNFRIYIHMCVAKCGIYRTFPKCPYNRLEALKWRWYFDNIVFKMHKQRNSMKYNTTIVIVSFTPRHTAERVTFTQTYGMTLNFLRLFLKSAWITLRTRLRKVTEGWHLYSVHIYTHGEKNCPYQLWLTA